MKNKGCQFVPGQVTAWMDCGNKNATVDTNRRVLEYTKDTALVHSSVVLENSVIIPPCFVGENVILKDCVIGPHVSVGNNTNLTDCVIKDSIIQNHSNLKGAYLMNSMVGNFVQVNNKADDWSVGDYTTINA